LTFVAWIDNWFHLHQVSLPVHQVSLRVHQKFVALTLPVEKVCHYPLPLKFVAWSDNWFRLQVHQKFVALTLEKSST